MRALLALCLAFAAGCATYQRGFLGAVSTANVPLERTVVAGEVEGRTCGELTEPQFRLAVDDALEKAPGANALVDATYAFENFCTVVRGTAVRIP